MKMSTGGECLRAARALAVDLMAGKPSLAALPRSTRNKCQRQNYSHYCPNTTCV